LQDASLAPDLDVLYTLEEVLQRSGPVVRRLAILLELSALPLTFLAMSLPSDDQGKNMDTGVVSSDKAGEAGYNSPTSTHGIDEKKLVRKIDWRIIPGVVLLYLLSFLDRSNVANARIEGLATDLNMSTDQALIAAFLLNRLQLAINILPA
jgi:hypothetical protein